MDAADVKKPDLKQIQIKPVQAANTKPVRKSQEIVRKSKDSVIKQQEASVTAPVKDKSPEKIIEK